ncbi:MAG: hypothetical protein AABZ30_15330 [Myxococcota bacterium]
MPRERIPTEAWETDPKVLENAYIDKDGKAYHLTPAQGEPVPKPPGSAKAAAPAKAAEPAPPAPARSSLLPYVLALVATLVAVGVALVAK